jgi:hypothetical protein
MNARSTSLLLSSLLSACGGAAGSPTGVGEAVDETLCDPNIAIASTKTIAAGTTTAVCAGTTLTVSPGAGISVQGKLILQGTADKPIKLVGTGSQPAAWAGVLIASGGNLVASHIEIHGARVALDARVLSSYQVDHVTVDTSAQLMNLASEGTISHGALHGLGSSQGASPVTIDGSPHIVDTVIDKGIFGGLDLIIVESGSPVFDHVEIADSHCGLHIGVATSLTITNSYIHHNSYAMMAGSIAGTFSHNNFQDNEINVGACGSVSVAVSGNYFAGAPFDGSCSSLASESPAGAPFTDVGPRP